MYKIYHHSYSLNIKLKPMRKILRLVSYVSILLAFASGQKLFAQSVMDPSDPVITYNPSTPPVEPAWGQVGKWLRTVRLSWNTSAYKAYIYKGNAFRLKFPKTYNPTAADGKKYP